MHPTDNLEIEIQRKIDLKTKPLGSLGVLEDLAKKICLVQNTLTPVLHKPTIVVFAADHGIAQSGVSAYPPSVTAQMVMNFLNRGAAINVFCKQQDIELMIADAGVDFDFNYKDGLIDTKIAKGTRNCLFTNAMTEEQLQLCFEKAGNLIDEIALSGCNIIGFGEMGIGNTSSASLLMSTLCNLPVEECTGTGTGLSNEQLLQKIKLLKQAIENHPKPKDVYEAMEFFGGFEIAQICGAMLRSFEKNMLILVDGFIATVAFACAAAIEPLIKRNAIFCHLSNEHAHLKILEYLNATPLLSLKMRLGEGTGCAVAFPLIQSAVNFINEMATFESAKISDKTIEK